MTTAKLCYKCKERKPVHCFSVSKNRKDGLNLLCRVCSNTANKQSRHKNIANNTKKLKSGNLDQPDKSKYCRICGDKKTLISEFWPRDLGRPDGFNTACKLCVAKKQQRPNEILPKMRQNAIKRDLAFNITIEDIKKHWSKPCYYCNEKTIGWLDRRDNSRGYEPDNVVPCCRICNKMKSDLSEKQFYNQIKLIIKNIDNRIRDV